jgi:hypothetical protein
MAADRCQRSTARRGKTLVFEDVACDWAPLRVRPDEDVLMRVVSGLILLTTDKAERLLEPSRRRGDRPGRALLPARGSFGHRSDHHQISVAALLSTATAPP